MIDIPFNPDYEVSKAEIAYVKAQFWIASTNSKNSTRGKMER